MNKEDGILKKVLKETGLTDMIDKEKDEYKKRAEISEQRILRTHNFTLFNTRVMIRICKHLKIDISDINLKDK